MTGTGRDHVLLALWEALLEDDGRRLPELAPLPADVRRDGDPWGCYRVKTWEGDWKPMTSLTLRWLVDYYRAELARERARHPPKRPYTRRNGP